LSKEHTIYGAAQQLDAVVCPQVVQLITSNGVESTIAAYWVTDSIICRIVAFLLGKYVKEIHIYDGKLAQIVGFLGGPQVNGQVKAENQIGTMGNLRFSMEHMSPVAALLLQSNYGYNLLVQKKTSKEYNSYTYCGSFFPSPGW
jgi:hypothetical protein